jgi:hypothetical protein
MKRLTALTVATASSVAMLGSVGTGAVSADASGCTYTTFPTEYVCAKVKGKKLYVDTVTVIRGKFDGAAMYDFHAEVTVKTPAGKLYTIKGGTLTGKRFARQYIDVRVKRSYPDGSKLCARAFERDGYVDAACFKIHD